jgi:hypothetical protein
MLQLTKYYLCIIATFPISEFPLHILEFVEGEGKIPPTTKDGHGPRSKMSEKQSATEPVHPDQFHHDSDGDSIIAEADTRSPSNSAFVTMLVVVGMLHLYMLCQVISFACQMQLSEQQTRFYQCFFWCLTLPTAARLFYGLSACARYFVYVYRPHWLPRDVPLRHQALEAFAVALVVTMKLLAVVFAGVLAKMMLYDPLMKLVVLVIYRGESGSRDLK